MRRRRALPALAALALLLLALGGGAAWARSHQDTPNYTLFTTALNGNPAALAVDGRTGRVFVDGERGAGGAVLDAADGAVLVPIPIPGSALAVDERAGTVFVVGLAGVSMLDAATGRFLRQLPVTTAPDTVAVDARAGHAFLVDPGSDTVHMLDTRTGAVLRTTTMVMTPLKVAVDGDAGQVYVTSDSPFASVLDARSGDPVRTAVLRSWNGPFVVDGRDGHLFVLDRPGGKVDMLDLRGGLLRRSIAVGGSPAALALDARRERLYVVGPASAATFNTSVPGNLYAIDARTGDVLRAVPVGVDPVAVAVDEASGRVFVAVRGGALIVPDAWRWVPAWLRDRLPFLPPPGPHLRTTSPAVTALVVPS